MPASFYLQILQHQHQLLANSFQLLVISFRSFLPTLGEATLYLHSFTSSLIPLNLTPDYHICRGSTLDKALLIKFMQRTYEETFPGQNFSHLQKTVEQYLSSETPVWWANFLQDHGKNKSVQGLVQLPHTPVGCLWAGNAIDQVYGERHAHIFLLYVMPAHRRQGIATALMENLELWAKARDDRQIGLQVFQTSTAALNLYQKFGYHTQSLWKIKPLQD